MKLSTLTARLSGCLLATATLAGCWVDVGAAPAPRPDWAGSLEVRWTIAGRSGSRQCAYYSVDSLELTVYDRTDVAVVTTDAPCEVSNVTVDLAPGVYRASVKLVDVNRRPKSLPLPLRDLRITTGTKLSVDVDFPSLSML